MNEHFFDRNGYLELLRKRIGSLKDGYRQNMAILGDELVGKSSMILKFLDSFVDTRTLALYIEIRPEPLAGFARRFIGIMLYNFLLNSETPLKEDLEFLITKSSAYIPKTCEKIRAILAALEKRKKNNVFTELLGLCDLFYQETGKFCVVILDEFHHFESFGVKNLYAEWQKLLIVQKTTLYILVSSLKHKAKTILSKNLALLFGNFEIITVEPFDIKTSESYLRCRLDEARLDKGLVNFIVHFTGGIPFYLDILSQAFLHSKERTITDILEAMLLEPSGILHQRFSNYLNRFLDTPHNQDYLAILYQVASGHNKIKEISQILEKPKKELDPRLNHLLDFNCLSRSGDFVTLNDRVFGFWLKFVYQQKLHSLSFNGQNQKMLFRGKIEKMIQEFLANSQKPLTERVAELLRLFEDEVMQVERKKLRLNHFREIKPLAFNGRNLSEGLLGRSRDSIWIFAFKRDGITEDDIAEFARECKRYHHKLQRKIMVSLQEVDSNARLRALEEKIWTWDLNNLNRLLDLYSKPRIIA